MGLITNEPTWMQVLRISIHLVAAGVWVGGLLVLAGLSRTLRSLGADQGRKVQHHVSLIVWPAYGVLLFTGIWNTLALGAIAHPVYELKLLAVAVSGLGALAHAAAGERRTLAVIGGATANLAAMTAMVLGVWLPLA